MKPSPVSNADMNEASATKTSAPSANGGQRFDMALEAAALEQPGSQSGSQPALGTSEAPPYIPPALLTPEPLKAPSPSGVTAAAAYRKAVEQQATPAQMSGLQMYKDDQLLRNPGGRNYYLDEKKVVENSNTQPVGALISKDFSAVVGNIKNFFGNMFLGTTVLHRNERNEITQGSQRGLLRTIGDFCTDLGSALSLGAWHPDSAEAPHGLKNRFLYSVSKLKDAFFGDILTGVPSSVNHMSKNLILSGLHLAEVLPDALTGGFEPGQKVTTAIFDNGHVALEYLTDIIPSGDAWLESMHPTGKNGSPRSSTTSKCPSIAKGMCDGRMSEIPPFENPLKPLAHLSQTHSP